MTTKPITTALMPTYSRLDKAFVKGEGCHLYDSEGNIFLDMLAGIGVVGLGHSDPSITKTITEQAARLIHTSNVYRIPAQEALAEKLTQIGAMDNCFFSNSGAETNEAAIKIARLHGRTLNIDQPQIIVMENAFHGRTLATLSATASRKVQAGFEPLVPGFIRVPFNNIKAIKDIAQKNKHIVAVMLEPVQGEGGINIAEADYLNQLQDLCEEKNWLLMLDEVQSGNGRTGKYFAFQHTSIKPDVVTTAKGLGNGLPIGACLAANKAKDLMKAGKHGSTYGGNHLVCTVALEVVNRISQTDFLAKVEEKGRYLFNSFKQELADNEKVVNVRHHGLMMGIELTDDAPLLVQQALEEGLLINVTSGKIIRLLPPLIIEKEQMDKAVSIIGKLLK